MEDQLLDDVIDDGEQRHAHDHAHEAPQTAEQDVYKRQVQFAIYTNSTLIDEPFCEEVVKLGNIAFMLSIEGTP